MRYSVVPYGECNVTTVLLMPKDWKDFGWWDQAVWVGIHRRSLDADGCLMTRYGGLSVLVILDARHCGVVRV